MLSVYAMEIIEGKGWGGGRDIKRKKLVSGFILRFIEVENICSDYEKLIVKLILFLGKGRGFRS